MVMPLFNSQLKKLRQLFVKQKRRLVLLALGLVLIFSYLKPQQFADLWLTRDQQGQLLFALGDYQQASNTFNNTRWQAFSAYANEDFNHAAILYGQYTSVNEVLARANALAQAEEYIAARNIYQKILDKHPSHPAASKNIIIVQEIIDEINRLSSSQQPEQGESIKELGEHPKKADGADKQESRKREVKQLTAEQLLLDPSLNEMWLRQVQKDPGNFLAQKFYLQAEQAKKLLNEDTDTIQKSGENNAN